MSTQNQVDGNIGVPIPKRLREDGRVDLSDALPEVQTASAANVASTQGISDDPSQAAAVFPTNCNVPPCYLLTNSPKKHAVRMDSSLQW